MELSTASQPVSKVIAEASPTETHRLVIFNPAGTAVLLEAHGSEYRLPTVGVPRFTRVAQEVTAILRDSWNLPSVYLFSGLLEGSQEPTFFSVIESLNGIRQHPPKTDWFTIYHALSHPLLAAPERRAVKSSFAKSIRRAKPNDPEPFGRLGWMHDLKFWARTEMRSFGVELKDFRQFNASETFSLVRFETDQRPVWFKAVGEPNLHEFEISLALARLFPGYMPETLATKPEWHGWLMTNGGTQLSEFDDPAIWKAAITTLGELQVQSINKTEEVKAAECRDLRTKELLDLIEPFFGTMAELMRRQPTSPPNILDADEIAELKAKVKFAIESMAALGIPDSLGHSDFNPGNILIDSDRCTFIDWAEAHLSHPFLTFEYLMAHLKKDYPQLSSFEGDFRAAYSRSWRLVTSIGQIEETYLFSPLVAIYAYALAGNAWRDAERLKIPGFEGYLRSLTRKMKKEADLLQRRRVTCPN